MVQRIGERNGCRRKVREKGRSMKKWVEIVRGDTKECGVDEKMAMDNRFVGGKIKKWLRGIMSEIKKKNFFCKKKKKTS